jgi:acetyl esterase
VLLSGAFDIAGVGDNWLVNSLLWAYTGKRDFRRDAWLQLMAIPPNLSTRFPPSFITSGNADPLLPQALALVQRMQALGMDIDTLFFADDHPSRLLHEYQFNLDSAEGQLSQQRLLGFLQRVTAMVPAGRDRQPDALMQ